MKAPKRVLGAFKEWGNEIRVPRAAGKWLIVAVDKNANPAGLTLAPFFIGGQL